MKALILESYGHKFFECCLILFASICPGKGSAGVSQCFYIHATDVWDEGCRCSTLQRFSIAVSTVCPFLETCKSPCDLRKIVGRL
jgi:hypothetical protein